ncbi:uncharacterized protein PGTG_22424 [Puccinia graminis f. sp. tritici CRL 75-36-700-3]|uniref:Uncharacterized protein n=1 Tax=Puccinia graminis f. sp. tritici (strain CRL 75-36-700-3 / race SCCL) TaxID=418459 RepID=H6QUF5_PUCGT|nr:uncharacterized protein PGTG_22424 [Puccinia graminis f. sp. tritici CRL 75-36-700-3]EHS64616.1 hypothetical protein PGTG_22424 [Puccinia graminis f. sp. tritici CRL 75-36-700-3]
MFCKILTVIAICLAALAATKPVPENDCPTGSDCFEIGVSEGLFVPSPVN